MKKEKLILLLTSLLIIYKILTIILKEMFFSNYKIITVSILLIIIFIYLIKDKNNKLIKYIKQGPRIATNKIRLKRRLKNFELHSFKIFFTTTFIYCLLGLFLGFAVKEISISNLLLILFLSLVEEILRSLLIDSKNNFFINFVVFFSITFLMLETNNIFLIVLINIFLTIVTYYSRNYLNILIRLIMTFISTYMTLKVNIVFNKIILSILIIFMILKLGRYIVSSENIKIRNLYSVITNIIYGSFIVVSLLFVLGLFNYKPLAVMSNSMSPEFEKGDMIIFEKTKNLNSIKINDIILYKTEDLIVVHRVVEKEKDSFGDYLITKGDNVENYDQVKIREKELIGRVKEIIPNLGYPAYWINNLVK